MIGDESSQELFSPVCTTARSQIEASFGQNVTWAQSCFAQQTRATRHANSKAVRDVSSADRFEVAGVGNPTDSSTCWCCASANQSLLVRILLNKELGRTSRLLCMFHSQPIPEIQDLCHAEPRHARLMMASRSSE